jgi:hypothetical protein
MWTSRRPNPSPEIALDKLSPPLPGEMAAAGTGEAPLLTTPKAMSSQPPKSQRRRRPSSGATSGDTTNADA